MFSLHPQFLYLPQEVDEGITAAQAAVSYMPGAWSAGTTIDMLTWVNEERYLLDTGKIFSDTMPEELTNGELQKSN